MDIGKSFKLHWFHYLEVLTHGFEQQRLDRHQPTITNSLNSSETMTWSISIFIDQLLECKVTRTGIKMAVIKFLPDNTTWRYSEFKLTGYGK